MRGRDEGGFGLGQRMGGDDGTSLPLSTQAETETETQGEKSDVDGHGPA